MDRGFLRHFPIARNHYRDFISILCGRKGGSDKTGKTKVLKQRNAKRRSTAFFFRRPTLIRAVFGAGSNSISSNSRATIWKFHCLSPTCKVGYVFLLPPKVTSFLCDISLVQVPIPILKLKITPASLFYSPDSTTGSKMTTGNRNSDRFRTPGLILSSDKNLRWIYDPGIRSGDLGKGRRRKIGG